MTKDTNAFLYVWIHYSGRWYVGYHKGYPWDGYITSSKLILPLIKHNPKEWKRIIIATGNMTEMLKLETKLLKLLDAKKSNLSFNQHNGDANFVCKGHTEEYKRRKSIEKKGKPNGHLGMKRSEATKERMRKAQKGRIITAEHAMKISIKLKGRPKK